MTDAPHSVIEGAYRMPACSHRTQTRAMNEGRVSECWGSRKRRIDAPFAYANSSRASSSFTEYTIQYESCAGNIPGPSPWANEENGWKGKRVHGAWFVS